MIGGCRRGTQAVSPDPPIRATGPLPAYDTVAAAHNQRVERLARLWSNATLRVWYPNEQGEEEVAQVEANLQYVRPDKVNLTLDKAGPLAVLGSNERRYWFIDLNKENRHAKIGEHARATPERVAELGLPVHPLDLIELFALTPLPTSWPSVGTGETPDLRWSSDGRWIVLSTPGRIGRRRLYFEPGSYLVGRVELTGPDGNLLASADLDEYEEAAGAGGAMVPTQILASVDRGRTRVRMRLDQPDAGRTPRDIAFDLDRLLQAYRIRNVQSLDEPPVGP